MLKRSPTELASAKQDTDRRLAVVAGSSANPQEDSAIILRAQALYCKLLRSGKSRTSERKSRMDCGRPLNNAKCKSSEKQWLQDRKAAVDMTVASLVTPPRRPPMELPDSVEKERKKQENVAFKRKAEAWADSLLLEKEGSDALRAAANKKIKEDSAHDQARARMCQSLTETVRLRVKKESCAWALSNLPGPAYFANSEDKGTMARWRRRLCSVGVREFTTATCFSFQFSRPFLRLNRWCSDF